MDSIVKHVFDHMPPPPNDMYEQFSNNNLAIFKAGMIFPGPAQFGCFEFIIPNDEFPKASIDGNRFLPESGKMFAVNPGQSHSCVIDRIVKNDYIAMFISKSFICETMRLICKKNEISFDFGSHPIDKNLKTLLYMFMDESSARQTGYDFILDCLGPQIAFNLLRQVKSNLPRLEDGCSYHDKAGIRRASEYLQEHYNTDCSMKDIAKLVNLSPYHFIRVFKNETGKTPNAYLMDIKLERACELLKCRHWTITEVCFQCGFKNLSYFTTLFRLKSGLTPSQYRKAHQI